jgi:hypothetical protein
MTNDAPKKARLCRADGSLAPQSLRPEPTPIGTRAKRACRSSSREIHRISRESEEGST